MSLSADFRMRLELNEHFKSVKLHIYFCENKLSFTALNVMVATQKLELYHRNLMVHLMFKKI